QANRALQGRLRIQQGGRSLDREDVLAGKGVLRTDPWEKAAQRVGGQDVVTHRDLEIDTGQHGLDVVDEIAQEKPVRVRVLQSPDATLSDSGRETRTGSVPTRNHVTRLGPGKHPRHR